MESLYSSQFYGFFIVFFIVSMVIPLFIKLAHKFNFLSKKNFRRKEQESVPLLGGLSIYISLIIVSVIFKWEAVNLLLFSALPIVLSGIMDDIYELRARYKFLAHILSLAIFFLITPQNQILLYKMGLPYPLAVALTGFWILGMINALNMIDGMDGEAGSFSIVASIFLSYYFWNTEMASLLLALTGGLLGFLIYNRPPAKIYLGDSGSSFLGFILSALGATIPFQETHFNTLLIPLFILAFPEMDAILAILRRMKRASSPFRGDHDHIHHKLQKLGLSIYQILFIFFLVSIYCGVTAYSISLVKDDILTASISFLSITGLLTFLMSIYYLEYRLAYKTSTYSHTLLKNHMPIKSHLRINPDHYQATVFDLLPYYKEIQNRGVEDVQTFVQDFAQYISKTFKLAQLKMIGSYSILVLETPQGEIQEELSPEVIVSYFHLLKKHRVQKNDTPIPWGLTYHTSLNKRDQFIKKFGLSDETIPETKIKRVA